MAVKACSAGGGSAKLGRALCGAPRSAVLTLTGFAGKEVGARGNEEGALAHQFHDMPEPLRSSRSVRHPDSSIARLTLAVESLGGQVSGGRVELPSVPLRTVWQGRGDLLVLRPWKHLLLRALCLVSPL
jgi:hypothetical protein